MASSNNYKLLIEAQLDPKKISSQITALRKSTRLVLDIQVNLDSLKKLGSEIAKIKTAGGKIGKVKIFEDDSGKISKVLIEYKNKLGQIEKITKTINKGVIATKTRYVDVNNVLKQTAKIKADIAKKSAKEVTEMEKAALVADKFLAKTKNYAKTKSVSTAMGKAEQIKVAVSEKDIAKVRSLSRELKVLQAGLSKGRTGLSSWSNGLKDAMKRTVEYSLSIGLLYGAMAKIKEGITYISDLNTEMTKIQVLQISEASSNEQIADLALQYNKLAKEIGSTTIEIARGSVEWLRQGKTVAETQELLKSTMYLSKLGNLESAESTEYLTAILNGFKMETEDAVDVVNKLVAIDNIAATSAGELATGLQYSSAVANEAGVSFETLAAMIGTVSSRTRLSAEMIGTAFRTMLVRMQQVKAGSIDETGMSLNNVEKVLSKINVSLRDSKDEFRNMEDVIADVAVQWEDLSSVQRAQISNAIAGQRQAQIFSSLMQNWGDVTGYLAEQTNSAGLAQRNYAVYLESVEAAQNKVKASWEGVWQATIESGAIKWFYDLGASILESITELGGLAPVITVAIALMALLNAEFVYNNALLAMASIGRFTNNITALITGLPKAIGMMKGLTLATKGFVATVGTANIVVGALILALMAVSDIKNVMDIQKSGLEANTEAWAKTVRRLAEEHKITVDIFDSTGKKIGQTTKTIAAETASVEDVIDRYVKKAEEVNAIYDDAHWSVKPFVDIQEILKQGLVATADELENTTGSYQEYVDAMKELLAASGLFIDEQGRVYRVVESGGAVVHEYAEGIEITAQNAFYLTKASQASTDAIEDNTDELGFGQQAYVSLGETLKDITDAQSSLNDIMTDAEMGTLSFDQMDELASLYPNYLEALSIEGDQLKLNTDMVREYLVAKADMAVKAAIDAGAIEKEIELLQAYADSLREQQSTLVAGMEVTTQHANEVFWNIANEAHLSGQKFVDLEGKALSSADSIYTYLASGDQAFNSFIQQAADITGLSTESIAQQINGMLNATTANVAQSINDIIRMGMQAGATMGQMGAIAPEMVGGFVSSGSVSLNIPKYTGGGGSGGGGSSTPKKSNADKEADKLKEIQDAIKKAQEDSISSLEDQLDGYGKLIDARKKILDSLKEERDYDRSIEEHNSEILAIQNEMASLQFDTSAEADARRKQLEDDLKKAELSLEDTQFDHSIDQQKDALDADYTAFEESISNAIKQIENIDATSVSDFSSQLAVILAGITPASMDNLSQRLPPKDVQTLHDGGLAGGKSGGLKSNEVFVKLMRGEPVVTEKQADNFMKNTLPAIANGESSGGGGDIKVDMPIHVAGNLDKSVIPDLEELANGIMRKINDAMLDRGHNRRSDLYST